MNPIQILFSGLFLFLFSAEAVFAQWLVPYPEQLFIEPGQQAVVELAIDSSANEDAAKVANATNAANAAKEGAEFRILDTDGKEVQRGKIQQGKAEIQALSSGFYELVVSSADRITENQDNRPANVTAAEQRFGVVCLGAFCTSDKATLANRDPFFCIDAAMSWLVKKEGNRREQLIQMARRSGISMLRERLRWAEIQPQDGPIQFDGNRGNYETLRKMYQANDVEVLELCHDSPDFPGRRGNYPDDLNKWADLWSVLVPRWESTWGGFEVWNEPDISFSGNLPADQYAPILKAASWKMERLGMTKPLLGCCMATYNIDWLDNARENEVYKYCDAFSFHNYGRAPEMASLYLKFAEKVNGAGDRRLPIWITECGRPWKRGKGRADAREDTISAVDIAMKAIFAKACGCERYFPFVFPYYDERENNFGMLDKACSPMRSFAGYVQLIRCLSGYEYAGDLPVKQVLGDRCLAFTSNKSGDAVLVLYTGDADNATEVQLPVSIVKAERITGESAVVSGQDRRTVTIRDGLVYAWANRADLNGLTSVNPIIAQIPAARKSGQSSSDSPTLPRAACPVVPKYLFDLDTVSASPAGYRVKRGQEKEFKLVLALDNLSDQAVETVVCPPEYVKRENKDEPVNSSTEKLTEQREQKVVCPARGRTTVEWILNLTELFDGGTYQTIRFRIASADSRQPNIKQEQSLALRFSGEPDWERLKSSLKCSQALDIACTASWKASQGANGKTTFTINEESTGKQTWKLKTEFGDGDCWTYPIFQIPKSIEMSKYRGILLKFRAQPGKQTIPRLFLYESAEGGKGAYMTTNSLGQTDGGWHCAVVWFDRLNHCSAAGTDKNGRLDLNCVTRLSLGGNTVEKTFELEVSDVLLIE